MFQKKIISMSFCDEKCIVIRYVDDCCKFSEYKDTIDGKLKNIPKTFNLTNEGYARSYFGMNVSKDQNVTITMSQPEIIDKILNILGICDDSKIKDTPGNIILTRYEDVNGRK